MSYSCFCPACWNIGRPAVPNGDFGVRTSRTGCRTVSGGLSVLATRAYVPILILAVGGTVFGLSSVTRTKCTARLHDMFPPDARIVQDYDSLEKTVGRLIPIEVAVRLPQTAIGTEAYQTPVVDQLQLVGKVGKGCAASARHRCFHLGVDLCPADSSAENRRSAAGTASPGATLERKLGENIDQFVQLGFLSRPSNSSENETAAAEAAHWWRIAAACRPASGWIISKS